MNLMQGYDKADGTVGFDNLKRWHSNSNAVSFLSATTSANTLFELKKVC